MNKGYVYSSGFLLTGDLQKNISDETQLALIFFTANLCILLLLKY